ncbi:MAG: hypothetical protein L0229_26335, partial [Blastocatellia bacterium]|nr:hypothetical protein [Blastocatellia bacterium]
FEERKWAAHSKYASLSGKTFILPRAQYTRRITLCRITILKINISHRNIHNIPGRAASEKIQNLALDTGRMRNPHRAGRNHRGRPGFLCV